MRVSEKYHQRGCEKGRGRSGGKMEWKSSEVNTRAVSRGQNELIGEFKMAAAYVISIWEQVMEDMYFQQELKGSW